MKGFSLIIAMVCFLAISCNQSSTKNLDGKVGTMSQKIEGEYFGEQFAVNNPIAVENAIKNLEKSDTLNIQLAGVVQKVCKAKGCWTNIGSTMEADQSIFVKFKDYGFFLPTDCDGREVILDGKAYIEETPVDELRHYAEDAGKSAEEIAAITEPAREYKFMASGALLKK